MIKRFLSMVLCLCLLCTASVALADNEVDLPDDKTANLGTENSVNITAVAVESPDVTQVDVYSIEVVWGDMQFAYGYTKNTTKTWDPDTHEFIYTVTGSTNEATEDWYMVNESKALELDAANDVGLTTQNAVMVFNHSSQPVDVKIAIDDVDDVETEGAFNLTATFTKKEDNAAQAHATEQYTWVLKEGKIGDRYENDGSCVMGTVKINEKPEGDDVATYKSAIPIAKLSVTVSKPASTTTGGDSGDAGEAGSESGTNP